MAVLPSPLVFLASIPPVTRGFTAATLISSILYAWLNWTGTLYSPYLVVVPGSSLFYPWTFVTSCLVETSIFEVCQHLSFLLSMNNDLQLIASLVFVPPSLKYLERLWGSIETLKFIAISVGFSNIIAFAFNWIEFVFTKDTELFL